MKLIIVLGLFLQTSLSIANAGPPSTALKTCETLKTKLQAEGIALRNISVPADYSKSAGKKLNIAYWVRPALEPTKKFPPMLFVHGGPAGHSNRLLEWPAIFRNYPGDIVALDVRGESCSSAQSSGMPIADYDYLRGRNIVRDLEQLRLTIYGPDVTWRYFGQSRGSVVGHYYLDMFPEALESLHVHGYSMGTAKSMQDYSRMRSFFSARASRTFVKKFPAAGEVLKRLKQWLNQDMICFNFIMHENSNLKHKVCGAWALDALSFELTNQGNWSSFATKLQGLLSGNELADFGVDAKAASQYLQEKMNGNTYVAHFNYIAGTNGQDMGHPNPVILDDIAYDPYIHNSPICEGRFFGEVMLPWSNLYNGAYTASSDPIQHDKILQYLKKYELTHKKKFQFNLYASENDTVAGPEAYDGERKIFGSYVNYQYLPDTGHDGWFTGQTVAQNLLKP